MMHFKRIYFFLLIFCFGTYHSFSQNNFHKEIPDAPAVPALVNDLGDMLTEDEEKKLEEKLFNYEKESSNEIAVVTINDLGGLDIAEYSVELGRKWNIGKAKKRNGVLVLASKNDRKIFIAPAIGLSGVLPDAICSRIVREHIIPYFKEGKYYDGLNQGTDKIILYSKGEFTADEPHSNNGISVFQLLIILLFIMLIFYLMARRRRGNTYVSRRGYKNDDNDWGGGMWGGGIGGFGGFGGGGSNSGGGGFGGFGGGGGGFDGGGAGGSW